MGRRRIRGIDEWNNTLTVTVRKVYLPNNEMLVFKTLYNIDRDLYRTKVIYTGTRMHTYISGIVNNQSRLTRKQVTRIQEELGLRIKEGTIQRAYLNFSTVTDDDGEKVYYQMDGRKITTKRYVVRDGMVEIHVEAKQSCGTKRVYNIDNTGNGRDISYIVRRLSELTI